MFNQDSSCCKEITRELCLNCTRWVTFQQKSDWSLIGKKASQERESQVKCEEKVPENKLPCRNTPWPSLLWWTTMYIIPHKMGTVLHSFLHYGGVGRQICSHDKRDPYLDFCNWIWREENQGVHIPLTISMFWSDTSNCSLMILLGPSHTSATSKFPNQLFTRYCCSTNPCTESSTNSGCQ